MEFFYISVTTKDPIVRGLKVENFKVTNENKEQCNNQRPDSKGTESVYNMPSLYDDGVTTKDPIVRGLKARCTDRRNDLIGAVTTKDPIVRGLKGGSKLFTAL